METLFRFNQVRKAHRLMSDTLYLDLHNTSVFQQQMSAIERNNSWLQNAKQLANQYAESTLFIQDTLTLPNEENIRQLLIETDRIILRAELEQDLDLRALLSELVEQKIPDDLATWLGSETVSAAKWKTENSILTIKLLPALHRLPIDRLANYLRALALLIRFDADSDFPVSLNDLKAMRRQPLQLPLSFTPARPQRGSPPDQDDTSAKLEDLAKQSQRLEQAIQELSALAPKAFRNTPVKSFQARLPPAEFRPSAIFKDELQIRKLRLAELLKLTGTSSPNQPANSRSIAASSATLTDAFNADFLAKEGANLSVANGALLAMRGLPAFDADAMRDLMLLTTEAREKISDATKQSLTDFNLSLDLPISESITQLLRHKQDIASNARQLLLPFGRTSIVNMGPVRIIKRAMPMAGFLARSPDWLWRTFPTNRVVAGSVPTTHSTIHSAGHTDLLVVKQQLVGYVTADIAAVRSIMQGELNESIKRQLNLTEQEFYRESETTNESERSAEQSDRFEMRKEVEETIKENLSAKGALTVSGSLGPQFEYQAHAEVAWEKSTESSAKAATEAAREVTEKASEKVIERVLTRQRTLTRTENESTVTQKLQNDTGAHVAGVYQWLNKVYQAQVFNYGMREVYDLMIPEPGAMLLTMFNRREAGVLDVEEVPALEIKPEDLNVDNYQEFVRLYKAIDVAPPPEPFLTISHNFHSGGSDDPNARYVHSAKLSIPKGYQAFRASVGVAVTLWDDWGVVVILGQQYHQFNDSGPAVHITDLNGETESIALAMVSLSVADIGLAAQVVCKATHRATQLWQAETYEKIVNAYRSRKAEQEVLIAERMMDATFQVKGYSPAQNLTLMREELKRLCISTLTEQHFDHFKAVNSGVEGLPELNFSESLAEGAYVRFFEQAFEWQNMSWITYPYFWGQKNQWENRLLLEDSDPAYQEFLKAGFARVVLPVREGWNAAVDHFRLYGEPWIGGSLPTVSDPLYLPIADELAERLNQPGTELPVGEPWPVVVPTQLIKLREDASLPRWEMDESGVWVER